MTRRSLETNINCLNLAFTMRPRSGFLRFYLYCTIIIGLLGLTDALLTFLKRTPLLYVRIVTLVLFLFVFFNILSIALFRRQNLERIVYVLPIYHIASYVLFLSLGLYLTFTAIIPIGLSFVLMGLQAVSSLFEFSFSIYLLQKFDFSPIQ